MENEIKIFENQNVKLEVNMKDETVWLTQEQMAKLFDRKGKRFRPCALAHKFFRIKR